jgi:hypothetical protein
LKTLAMGNEPGLVPDEPEPNPTTDVVNRPLRKQFPKPVLGMHFGTSVWFWPEPPKDGVQFADFRWVGGT